MGTGILRVKVILSHSCMRLMVRGINIDFGIVIYSDSSGMALPAWHCVGHSKWCWRHMTVVCHLDSVYDGVIGTFGSSLT